MRIDLLERMVGVLSTMAPFDVEPDGTITRVFDMEIWADDLFEGESLEYWNLNEEKFCGFTGCAVGTCFQKGIFEGTDLRLDPDPQLVSNSHVYGYRAVAYVLDISFDDCFYLFHPDNYTGKEMYDPKVVAKRIQDYIEEHRYDG